MSARPAEIPLFEWAAGAQALAVLRAAQASGVLDALRSPASVDDLAAATGRARPWLAQLCRTLEAHAVVVAAPGGYVLSEPAAALADPAAPQPLPNVLAGLAARTRQLEVAGSSAAPYTELSPEEHVATAVGTGVSPLTEAGRAAFAGMARAVPVISEQWERGATHLEVGCGAGNALLSFAAAFPRLRAVGVELDGAVIAETRRRARLLGLGERVELRHLDARELDDVERFDTAQWSQLFFPADTRAGVLRALHRAMRPGGLVIAPTLDESAPGDPRASALRRLVVAGWDVPLRTRAELRDELEAAGFEVLEQDAAPAPPLAISDGFALARRP